ncbi:MAG: hypothetical protein H0T73_18190 [Ardenticatenales bacterium]|nr:hypothetical protein [Ardenticatenales bacterium]
MSKTIRQQHQSLTYPYLNPQAEHILDWFHLTTRLTVLRQCARGLPTPPVPDLIDNLTGEKTLEHCLESVKHYLWHGNTRRALDRLADIKEVLESWFYDEEGIDLPILDRDGVKRMRGYVREMDTYIARNSGYIAD